jgi:membrane protease YdiL (CAAX protease family)
MLVAYNTVTNLHPNADRGYVTRNAVAGALLVQLARRRGLTWGQLGLAPGNLGSGWRWGTAGAVVMTGTVALWVAVVRHREFGQRVLSDRRADLTPRELAWQALVRIPIGTAAFEEMAFRGVLFALLHHAGGPRAALAGSSAAFGLWHVGPALATFRRNDVRGGLGCPTAAAIATTAMGGAALASLRMVSGHVLAGWMAHWASNAVGLIIAALWQRTRHAAHTTVDPAEPGSWPARPYPVAHDDWRRLVRACLADGTSARMAWRMAAAACRRRRRRAGARSAGVGQPHLPAAGGRHPRPYAAVSEPGASRGRPSRRQHADPHPKAV